jgi:hypothetical protein
MMQETNPYLLTLPELLSAKKKISRVSAHHDPEKTSFKGMECLYLDPTQFREQLKRTFLIVLTDGELGALVTLLDTVCVNRDEGCVSDCVMDCVWDTVGVMP